MSLCCCKLDQEPSWLSLGALRTSLILKWSGGIPTFSGFNFTLNTDWSSHEIPKVDPATKREKSRWPTVRAFRHFRFADGVFGLGSRVSANKQANMAYEHATHTHTHVPSFFPQTSTNQAPGGELRINRPQDLFTIGPRRLKTIKITKHTCFCFQLPYFIGRSWSLGGFFYYIQ